MKQILILITLINCFLLNGQQDTLYILGEVDELLSKKEVDNKIKDLSKNLENDTSEWVVRFELEYEDKRTDTLIQHGVIHLIVKSMLSEEDKNKFLINKQVPEFQFLDIKGKAINEKDLEGKVVMLNFWFTKCPPCIAEMPLLNELKDNYKGQKIEFLSMAPEKQPQLIEFLKSYEFQFRHIPDADDFLKKFGVGFPKNILIDKKGIIRYIGGGIVSGTIEEGDELIVNQHQISWGNLRIQIDKLLLE